MPTAPTNIGAAPTLPDRADQATFSARMYALWVYWTTTFKSGVEALGTNVYNNAVEANADAIATAADRVQTGLDVIATAADRVQTGLDRIATAADRVQTGLDVVACAALLDQFDDRYLGVKAADPTLDNDGNALVAGAIYINSVSGFIRVYTGSTWVQGISAVAGVESINALQGAVTLKTVNGEAITGAGNVVITTAVPSLVSASGNVTKIDNIVDTSAGAITLTLPASPALGDAYIFRDASGTFGTNALTLGRNGSTIQGSASDLVCDVAGLEICVWFNSTTWRIL